MVVEHARDCSNSNLSFSRYVIDSNSQMAPLVSIDVVEGLPKNVCLFAFIVKQKIKNIFLWSKKWHCSSRNLEEQTYIERLKFGAIRSSQTRIGYK